MKKLIEKLKEIDNKSRPACIGIITCMCLICMIPMLLCFMIQADWMVYTDFGSFVAILCFIVCAAGMFGLLVPFVMMIEYLFNSDDYAPGKYRKQQEEDNQNGHSQIRIEDVYNKFEKSGENRETQQKRPTEEEKKSTEPARPAETSAAPLAYAAAAAYTGSHYYEGRNMEVEAYDEYGNRMDEMEFEMADEYYDEYGDRHVKNDNISYSLADEDEPESGLNDPFDDMEDFDGLSEEDKNTLRNEAMLDDFIIFNGGNPYNFEDRMDAMFDPFGFGDDD